MIKSNTENYSFYNTGKKIISLGRSADKFTLIHELGHRYDDAVGLFADKEFRSIIKSKFSKYTKKILRL